MLTRSIYGPDTGIRCDALAIEALNRALALDPDNFRARLKQAENYLMRPTNYGGDPERGYRLRQTLRQRRHDHSRVLHLMSCCHDRNNAPSSRRRYLEAAIVANPNEYRARWVLEEMAVQDRRNRRGTPLRQQNAGPVKTS